VGVTAGMEQGSAERVGRRWCRVGAAAYVAVRVALTAAVTIPVHPDTPSYRLPPDFIGGRSRPWVMPTVMWLLPDRGVVIAQAALSAVAFIVFAAAVRSTIRRRELGNALSAFVLLVGLSERVVAWDVWMLTESISLSLSLLLIAAFIQLDRVNSWLFMAVFAAWVFTRDAHFYLGLMVTAGVAVWVWRRRARGGLLLGCVVVMAWGLFAAGNDNTIERYNVTANVAWHVGRDVDQFRWFVDHGMPPSSAFFEPSFLERHELLRGDPEFVEWADTAGPATYARYLATHPSFLLAGIERLVVDGDFMQESLVDHSEWHGADEPPGVPWIWPKEASAWTLALLIGALVAVLYAVSRHAVDERFMVPGILVLSTAPHALLAYHASPFEIARHGVVLALTLALSTAWLIALALDEQRTADLSDT
jgi:hypothetical protein